MKNRFNKGFEETKQNKVPKYGIRKLKVGVVSCLLAFSMFAPAVGAHAEGTPAHVDLDIETKAKADKLYKDVNDKLAKIAKSITDELAGIQQLEANIDKATGEANAKQKAEEDAKKDLAAKKADYEVKKKEFAKAEENLKQRDTEFKVADKAQKKAQDHKNKTQAAYEAATKYFKVAGEGATKADENERDAAKTELDNKQKALKDLQDKNAIYDEYVVKKKVTKGADLADDDKYVLKNLETQQAVKTAVENAQKDVKYDSSNAEIKKALDALNNYFKDYKKGHAAETQTVALEKDGDTGCAKLNSNLQEDTKKDPTLLADLTNLNDIVKAEKKKIDFNSDIQTIKDARKNALPAAKNGAYTNDIPHDLVDTKAREDECEAAQKAYDDAENKVNSKNSKKDSVQKRIDKAEQKNDAAENALDSANDALEIATDNKKAAEDKKELAENAKKDAKAAKDAAHTKLKTAHEQFREAKENLRATIKGCKEGYHGAGQDKYGFENLGMKGLRENIANELKAAEEAYSSVEQVVKSRESKIKMYQDLVASTKKFAAMSGDTDASESFDTIIETYNDNIDNLTDEVSDYKEKLAESTGLITVIRQLAEKAKVLKPRNLPTEGWHQEGTDWTYTDSIGMTVKDNWVQGKNGDWFYLDGFGKMAHDKWVEVNKKWFYAGSNGVIAQEQWIQNKLGDWFYVKKGGYMAQNEWVQVKGQWYYAQKDGNMAKNVTLNVNGVNYSFNANCAWVK